MSDPLAEACRLDSRIRESADKTEHDRRLPASLVDELRDAGLFRMAAPASVGGLEMPLRDVVHTMEEVSCSDGSTGWCVMIAATSGVAGAYLRPEAARSIFSPAIVAGGVFTPAGRAESVEGGYRVTGRWRFASGCEHCDWFFNGCVIDGAVAAVAVPREHVEIIDTWDVSGLRGTGSHDVSVTDMFVPKDRTFSLLSGPVYEDGPLYRFPLFGLLSVAVASVAVGIARRAIEEIVELAAGKVPTLGRRRLAARGVVQADVARAEALYASARAFLYEAIDEAWEAKELSISHRARLRLASTNAARACSDAVGICYDLGGATSIYSSSALQRCFRDIHALTQHMVIAPATYELLGRVRLGLEADTSML